MWIVWSRADTPTPSAARILRRCWSRGPKMVSSRLESTTGTVERGMRCRQRRPAGRKRWLDGAMRTRPLTPPDASIAAASPEHHTRATQPSALCKRDGSSSREAASAKPRCLRHSKTRPVHSSAIDSLAGRRTQPSAQRSQATGAATSMESIRSSTPPSPPSRPPESFA
jgi:hypothetical protein